MDFIFYLLIVGGLLVFLSQASYARVAAIVYGYRDQDAIPSMRPILKKCDIIHGIHHAIHAICALLMTVVSLGCLSPDAGIPTLWLSLGACSLLAADAISVIINDKRNKWSTRMMDIRRKWKAETVFRPEYDSEVSLYRLLKEITSRNVLRDCLHGLVFVILMILSRTL